VFTRSSFLAGSYILSPFVGSSNNLDPSRCNGHGALYLKNKENY
jgi:hypothetical protein